MGFGRGAGVEASDVVIIREDSAGLWAALEASRGCTGGDDGQNDPEEGAN